MNTRQTATDLIEACGSMEAAKTQAWTTCDELAAMGEAQAAEDWVHVIQAIEARRTTPPTTS